MSPMKASKIGLQISDLTYQTLVKLFFINSPYAKKASIFQYYLASRLYQMTRNAFSPWRKLHENISLQHPEYTENLYYHCLHLWYGTDKNLPCFLLSAFLSLYQYFDHGDNLL